VKQWGEEIVSLVRTTSGDGKGMGGLRIETTSSSYLFLFSFLNLISVLPTYRSPTKHSSTKSPKPTTPTVPDHDLAW
jgi:hypothetical protein